MLSYVYSPLELILAHYQVRFLVCYTPPQYTPLTAGTDCTLGTFELTIQEYYRQVKHGGDRGRVQQALVDEADIVKALTQHHAEVSPSAS